MDWLLSFGKGVLSPIWWVAGQIAFPPSVADGTPKNKGRVLKRWTSAEIEAMNKAPQTMNTAYIFAAVAAVIVIGSL